jgi:hypothetical protein
MAAIQTVRSRPPDALRAPGRPVTADPVALRLALRGFTMVSASIPWSAHRLYLGRGFRWDQRHTQRLFEARQPANQPLLDPSWWTRFMPGVDWL